MVRPLTLLAAFLLTVLTVVSVGGGTAEARRPICEADSQVSLPDAQLRADEERAPAAPAERTVCIPGFSDDSSCWPDQPIPSPGPRLSLGSTSSSFVAARAPVLPRPSARALRHDTDARPLAAGFARLLERPPRSVSVVSA